MSKLKDTDFLYISTRLRSMENRMLSRERMERMLEARTDEDAAKVLSECGYTGLEKADLRFPLPVSQRRKSGNLFRACLHVSQF